MRHSGVARIAASLALWAVVCTPRPEAAPPHPAPLGYAPYVYACGRWYPHQPPQARGVFDVSWLRERVGAEERRAIEDMGGVVVHEFNVCAVRARLWVAKIPPTSDTVTMRIDRVESPRDYTVNVRVHMPLPHTAADRQFLIDLGAVITIEETYDFVARVPDEAIPTIRANPRVRWVWAAGQFGCFD